MKNFNIKDLIFKKNKRGDMGIVFFFLILFTIVIIGFTAAIVVSLGTYVNGEITPIMTELGMVGDTNLSEISEYTFGTTDTIIQALPWLVAFTYVVMLIFSMVFVMVWKYNPNPMFMGFYFMMVILLIFLCIIMSNMYQDIYTGTDVLATGLQDQAALSYMILYSPFIMTLIAFIVGIYMFAGKQTELQGGFGV